MILPSRPAVVLAIKGDRAAHTMGLLEHNGTFVSRLQGTLHKGAIALGG